MARERHLAPPVWHFAALPLAALSSVHRRLYNHLTRPIERYQKGGDRIRRRNPYTGQYAEPISIEPDVRTRPGVLRKEYIIRRPF